MLSALRRGGLQFTSFRHISLRKVAGDAGWSAVAHALQRGANVIAFMLLSHWLSPTLFAHVSYFNLAAIYVASFSLLGMATVITRAHARTVASDTANTQVRHVIIVITLALLAVLGTTLTGFPAIGPLPRSLFVLTIAALILDSLPYGVLSGHGQFRALAVTAFASALTTLVLVGLGAIQGSASLAVWALACGAVVKLIGDLLAARPFLRIQHRSLDGLRWSDFVEDLRSSGILALVSLLVVAGMWGIARIIKGDALEEFAIYSIGLQWYAIGAFVAANATRAMLPVQVRLFELGADAQLKQRRLLMFGAILGTIPALALALFAYLSRDLIVMAYGSELAAVRLVVPISLCVAVTVAPLNMIGNAAVAGGLEKYWLATTGVWLGIVAFGICSVPIFGWYEALCTLAAANLGQSLLTVLLLRRAEAI